MADVYGSHQVFEDIIDGFKSILDSMISDMASGYDPTISYAYDKHTVAAMLLNAVSIGITDGNFVPGGLADGVTTHYDIAVEIRIHTAYADYYLDEQQITRLINSVDNYVNARKDDIGVNYWIEKTISISIGDIFEESATQGGTIAFLVKRYVEHTQA